MPGAPGNYIRDKTPELLSFLRVPMTQVKTEGLKLKPGDICIHIADSLCYTAETNTTL